MRHDSDMATPRRARVETTGERTAVTPLELFFDLVFVFAITQITDLMAEDPTVGDVFRGVLVIGVLWWTWVGTRGWATSRAPTKASSAWRCSSRWAASSWPRSRSPRPSTTAPAACTVPTVFAVCYFVVRLVHLFLFWIVSREDRVLRGQVLRWAPSMVVGTVLLLIAAQTSGTTQTLLWVGALLGDYLGTYLAGTGWRLASASHFAERHGLIVLIALGESIVATGIGIAKVPVSLPIVAAVLLGLAVSGALWWAYFDVTALLAEHALAAATGERQIRLARGGYTFLHLPMIIGVRAAVAGPQEGHRVRRGRSTSTRSPTRSTACRWPRSTAARRSTCSRTSGSSSSSRATCPSCGSSWPCCCWHWRP